MPHRCATADEHSCVRCPSPGADVRQRIDFRSPIAWCSTPFPTVVRAREGMFACASHRGAGDPNAVREFGLDRIAEDAAGVRGASVSFIPRVAKAEMSDQMPIPVEVLIEVPRGGFLKRGSTGHVDFVSPLPCPFNYGSVPKYVGLEGDLLDAVVLGHRLSAGTTVATKAWGAVTLIDRGMEDDKLVCSSTQLTERQRSAVIVFFQFYSKCKSLLNMWRGRPGRNECRCWRSAESAIARARPRDESWIGSPVEF